MAENGVTVTGGIVNSSAAYIGVDSNYDLSSPEISGNIVNNASGTLTIGAQGDTEGNDPATPTIDNDIHNYSGTLNLVAGEVKGNVTTDGGTVTFSGSLSGKVSKSKNSAIKDTLSGYFALTTPVLDQNLTQTGGKGFNVEFVTTKVGSLSGSANGILDDGITNKNESKSAGTLDITGSNNATYSGSLSGLGSLKLETSAQQILTGQNTYSGTTNINGGTLEVSQKLGGNINVAQNATLDIIGQQSGQTYGSIISDGVNSHGNLELSGKSNVTLTGASTYSGTTTINPDATLHLGDGHESGVFAKSLTAITDNGTLLINEKGSDILKGKITGSGKIEQQAGHTTIVDESGFAGETTVTSGIFEVDNNLGGTINVSGASTLEGTGAVGSTMISDQASIEGGNDAQPYGTLAVNGYLTINNGEIIANLSDKIDQDLSQHNITNETVKTTDGQTIFVSNFDQSNHINVTGTIDFAGKTALNLQTAPGMAPVGAGTAYEIIHAGAIENIQNLSMENVSHNLFFYDGQLVLKTIQDGSGKGQDIDLIEERNANDYSNGTNSQNQVANHILVNLSQDSVIMQGLNSVGSRAQSDRIMKSLSGEIHSSARTAMIEDSYFIRKGILDRLDSSNCDESRRDHTIGIYDLKTGEKDGACSNEDVVMWGEAYGSIGHNGGDGNASSMHHMTTGFMNWCRCANRHMARWWYGGLWAF